MTKGKIKPIIILNGSGGSGKNTFAELIGKYLNVWTISSVDEVKKIASLSGWDGKKTDKDRKFLSDLKILMSDYNDYPFQYLLSQVKIFQNTICCYDILTIDIREPEEISRAVKEFKAKTLLIKRSDVPEIKSNMADANVDNYDYDYVNYIVGTIQDLENLAIKFIKCLEVNI